MSQVTGPLVLQNATANDANFAPVAVSPTDSVFAERSASVSAGFITLATGLSPASSRRATNRVHVNLDMPVLATEAGVSKIAYTLRFKGEFILPDLATGEQRADMHAFVANAIANAQVKAQVVTLDPMY